MSLLLAQCCVKERRRPAGVSIVDVGVRGPHLAAVCIGLQTLPFQFAALVWHRVLKNGRCNLGKQPVGLTLRGGVRAELQRYRACRALLYPDILAAARPDKGPQTPATSFAVNGAKEYGS